VKVGPPTIITQPVDAVVAGGGSAVYSVQASSPSDTTDLIYHWYVVSGNWIKYISDDDNHYSGSSTSTLTVNNVDSTMDSGNSVVDGRMVLKQYICSVGNSYGVTYTKSVNLVLDGPYTPAPPVVSFRPETSQTAFVGKSSFLYSGIADGSKYQIVWQASEDLSSWQDLTDNSVYSGTGNNILQVKPTAASLPRFYRAKISNAGGTIYTDFIDLVVQRMVFQLPAGIAIDSSFNLRVVDYLANVVVAVDSHWNASILAGQVGVAGGVDSFGGNTSFRMPENLAISSSGDVIVADTGNNAIRRLNPSSGTVTTLAGSPDHQDYANGVGSAAWFSRPAAVATDSAGVVYVADSGNNVIRKISPEGSVSTLAGTAGQYGSDDGVGSAARFTHPMGIAVAPDGSVIYVADTGNHLLRRVAADGSVTTVAGLPGVVGATDGAPADVLFQGPTGLALDSDGSLYIGDKTTVRKFSEGTVKTLAGVPGIAGHADGSGSNATMNIAGIAVRDGIIFIADVGGTIRSVYQNGLVSTLPIIWTGSWLGSLAPVFTIQPTDTTVAPGSHAFFQVRATGTPTPTLRWQRCPVSSSDWSDLRDSMVYNGADGTVLSVNTAGGISSGDQFRCVAANSYCTTTSSIATLWLTATPPPPTPTPIPQPTPVPNTSSGGGGGGGGGAFGLWLPAALGLLVALRTLTRGSR
jgi:DNA-binding beta-propeller fold protein YncE